MKHTNTCWHDSNGLVQKYIGTAYDKIKLVADNLDMLQELVDSTEGIQLIFLLTDKSQLDKLNTDYFRVARMYDTDNYEYYDDYMFDLEFDKYGEPKRDEEGKLLGTWNMLGSVFKDTYEDVTDEAIAFQKDKVVDVNVLKAVKIIGAEATEGSAGTMKLYLSLGTAEDGTITQKLITNELNKKVNKTSIVPVTKDSTVDATQVPDAPSLKVAFVNIDALNTKTSKHDSDIQGLKGTDTLHDGEIEALKEKDSAQDSRLTAIETLNTEQDARLDSIEKVGSDNKADIVALYEQQQTNTATIAEHATALSNQETLLNTTVEKLETTNATLVETAKTANEAAISASSASEDAINSYRLANSAAESARKSEEYAQGLTSKIDSANDTANAAMKSAETALDATVGGFVSDEQGNEVNKANSQRLTNELISNAVGDIQKSGIGEWNKEVSYIKGALTQFAGVIYRAKEAVKGESPSSSSKWERLLADKVGTSEVIGMSQNAVKKELDKKVSAADLTQTVTADTLKAPSNFAVKVELDKKLDKNSFGTIPIGATIEWQSSAPIPDGFMANEGRSFSEKDYPELAKAFPELKLPDDRGYVKRGLDITGTVDPDGKTRKVGDTQGDAQQPIVGEFSLRNAGGVRLFYGPGNGPFRRGDEYNDDIYGPPLDTSRKALVDLMTFDSSRVVKTAAENRMKNKATIFITRVK